MNTTETRNKSLVAKNPRLSIDKKSLTGSTQIALLEEKRSSKSSQYLLPDHPKINYQDELVLVFFKSMLGAIVEDWTRIEDVCTCVCSENPPAEKSEETSVDDMNGSDGINESQSNISTSKRRDSEHKDGELTRRSSKISQHSQHMERHSKISLKQSKISIKSASKKSITASIIEEEEELGDTSTDWILDVPDENVLIRFKNGSSYEGPVSRLLMHGYGKFVWDDGAIYEGDFVNGNITGQGTLKYPNLITYEGGLCKNFLHGEGVLNLTSTPMRYSGFWKAGKKHGKGWLLYEPGNWYDGEWFEDDRQGQGLRYYKSGEKYTGSWYEGKRHGQGTHVWSNNDLYKGEWVNGKMAGYGEYTWDAFLNETFCFPVENTYKGTWENGKRHGIGMMTFGTKNGAKLAGMWDKNEKHGAGVFVCDSGKIIERNPLFLKDKPVQIGSPEDTPNYEDMNDNSDPDRSRSVLQLLSLHVLNKGSNPMLQTFIVDCIGSAKNRSPNVLRARPEFKKTPTNEYTPQEIPMSLPPELIDVSYYIDLVMTRYGRNLYNNTMSEFIDASSDTTSSQTLKHSKWTIITNTSSIVKSQPLVDTPDNKKDIRDDFAAFRMTQSITEEKNLRNTITLKLSNLLQLYHKYATIATNATIEFKPVLVRLFMWQMLRDLHIVNYRYSLIDIDNILIDNACTALEMEHHPFEKIYFWQFLHIMLTLAWILHTPCDVTDANPRAGLLATIFNSFLVKVVEKNVRITRGCSIFEYRDIVPVTAVYLLYKSVGEPHSARKLLNSICVRKHDQPPCYYKIFEDEPTPTIKMGHNVVCVGENIIYLPEDPPDFGEPPREPLPELPRSDPFRRELYALRSLGPKKVVECLKTVCPYIERDGFIINMEYQLSFIEFYETILLCVFRIVDKQKKHEEKVRLREEKKQLAQKASETSADLKGKKDKKKGKLK